MDNEHAKQRSGKTIFYVRVSTRDQNPDLQVDAAKRLGVRTEHIFIEKASGARHDRPVLAEALATLKKGDTLACYKLDRIGRSLAHVTKLLADLEARGVAFRTIEDGLSTQGSTGKLILHILASVAEFERSLLLERVRDGVKAAKDRKVKFGRKPTWDNAKVVRARELMAGGRHSPDEVAGLLKVSRRTLFRMLAKAREHDAATWGTETPWQEAQ